MNNWGTILWNICAVIGAIGLGIIIGVLILTFVVPKVRDWHDELLCWRLTRHNRQKLKARLQQKADPDNCQFPDLANLTERDYIYLPNDVRPVNRLFRLRPSLPSTHEDDPSSQRN